MNSIHSIVYTVTDIDASKAVHTALLGVEPHTDTPYYVGYNVGGVEIALAPGPENGTVAQVLVEDVAAALTELQAAGAALRGEPKDVGGGLIATVSDPSGNVLGVMQRS